MKLWLEHADEKNCLLIPLIYASKAFLASVEGG
jgi:hypothetical protein